MRTLTTLLRCFSIRRKCQSSTETMLHSCLLMTSTKFLLRAWISSGKFGTWKKVLVGIGRVFEVGDHDFTRCSLTPNVALVIDIPDSIEGSFYHGRVFVGLKHSIFDPFSPHSHATELNSLLTQQNDPNSILILHTDSGPDHRVNSLSVQLSLIAVFLAHDLDCLITVRTPPFNSWKNPAERVMSELNLAL